MANIFFDNALIRAITDAVNYVRGANIQVPPDHGLPVPSPLPTPPTSPQSLYSPNSETFQSPTKEPLPRKPKRKRNDESISEFVAMLVEAVDRVAAQLDMEERLKQHDRNINECNVEVEELRAREAFLLPLVEGIPALQRELHRVEVEIYNAPIHKMKDFDEQPLVKRGLGTSRIELARLMSQIYDGLDEFMNSIGEEGRLPPFHDETGRLRNEIFISGDLSKALRLLADCDRSLRTKKEAVGRKRRRFLRATASERTATSAAQQQRRAEDKSEKGKIWSKQNGEYDAQRKRQEQRERKVLLEVVKPWLIEHRLINLPPDAPSAAGNDDEDGGEDEEYDFIHPAEAQMPFKSPLAEEQESSDGDEERQEKIDQWKEDRKTLYGQRIHLMKRQRAYASDLADHLYSFPRSSVEVFDAQPIAKKNVERQMEEAVQELENEYQESRNEAKEFRSNGLPIRDLPLSPEWAASLNDAEPENAPSVAYSAASLDRMEKKVNQFKRGVKRAAPADWVEHWPDGSPGGKKGRTGPFSPTGYKAMPEIDYDPNVVNTESPELNKSQIQEQLRRLREKNDEWRKKSAVGTGKRKPVYHQSPVVPDDQWPW